MTFPKVIRPSPRRMRFCYNGNEVTPPTYRLFGVDDEGKGIYRCYQTVISIDEHEHAWIPRRKFKSISLWQVNSSFYEVIA